MYDDTRNKILALTSTLFSGGQTIAMLLNELKETKEGKQPYSASGRVAIQDLAVRFQPFIQVLS